MEAALTPLADPAKIVAYARLVGMGDVKLPVTSGLGVRIARIAQDPAPVPGDSASLHRLFRKPVAGTARDPEPTGWFDLREGTPLAPLEENELREHPEVARLARLQAVLEELASGTASDRAAVYRRTSRPDLGEVLVKEACRGRASRAVFPITEAFRARANIVDCALRGRAVLVTDVRAHVEAGRPYFEGDPDVRSELVVPVIHEGSTLGVVDLESFASGRFGPSALSQAIVVALLLVHARLLVASL